MGQTLEPTEEVMADAEQIRGAYITEEIMQFVLDRQRHRCAGCANPLQKDRTHFDHRHLVICGGSHTVHNFEALCLPCHQKKMRMIRREFAERARARWYGRPKG